MDAVRQLITRRLKQTGLSAKEVSLNLGRNETYLQQYLTRGSPRKLDERDRERIAEMLGVPADDLRGPDNPRPARTNGGAPSPARGTASELERLRDRCWLYERALRKIVDEQPNTSAAKIAAAALLLFD
jgi:hypothetical protein